MADRYTNTIDAFAVDGNEMRVSGRVNIVPSDARELGYDGEVLIVMLGRMSTPTFRETKDGDVLRVDVMKPIEARVVSTYADRKKLMDKMGFEHEAQLSLSFNEGKETGTASSPITLLTPLADSPEDNLLGEDEEPPVEDAAEPPIVDDSPIEDDYIVEGEPEPELEDLLIPEEVTEATGDSTQDAAEEPASDKFDELFAQVNEGNEVTIVDDDEEEFLSNYFGVGTATSADRDERGRAIVAGQSAHDERLRKFLEG